VPGIGIAVPVFFPAVTTAVVALLLSREFAAPLAYVGGSLGTLIGADLTNLDKVRGLGAPVASIGGAGTFDGIFLTGILAVLLAGLYHRRQRAAVLADDWRGVEGQALVVWCGVTAQPASACGLRFAFPGKGPRPPQSYDCKAARGLQVRGDFR
jgi:hypothetical protein